MVLDEGDNAWAAELREDWGIQHLVQALRLGEGFRFHILSCDTPRAARATLHFLKREVGRRLCTLRPPAKRGDDPPVTLEELLSSVLEPLVAPLSLAQGPWLLAIDASDVREEDEQAWREVFRRMNERRNGLVRHIEAPLLLCASPRIEVAFAQEAPDFWSIRSTRVEVPPLRVEEISVDTLPAEERVFLRPSLSFEVERLRQEITQARQSIAKDPGDLTAQATLSVWLQRLGHFLEEQTDLQGAHAAFEEVLRIRSVLAQQNLEDALTQAAYAEALMDSGYVEILSGSLERAQSLYKAALEIMDRLLSKDPGHPEWRSGMAIAEHQLGMIAQRHGAYEESLDWYRRALQSFEELGDRAKLAVSYHQLGTLAQGRGAYDEALDWFKKSLQIEEELGNRAGMAMSFHALGLAAQRRGTYDEALGWYKKSLQIIEELGDRQGIARTYHQLGRLAEERGSYEEARDWYQRSLQIVEELGNQPGMAATLGQLGVLATKQGNLEEGLLLNVRSLALGLQAGMPEVRINLRWLRRQQELLGEKRFRELLRAHLEAEEVEEILKAMAVVGEKAPILS